MRVKAARVDALVQRITAAADIVAQAKLDSLSTLVEKSNQAKGVAQTVAQRFKEMDAPRARTCLSSSWLNPLKVLSLL